MSSSLVSVVLHGTLIAGFSFNIGSELSRDAGVSRFSIQLKSMNTREQAVESLAPVQTTPEDTSLEVASQTDGQPDLQPVVSSQKPARKKVSKIEKEPEPVQSRTEVQDQPGPDRSSDIFESSGEEMQESAEASSEAGSPESVNTIDPVEFWLLELQQRINRYRRYPRQALKRGLEGDVRVKAIINTNGSLAYAEVLSGHRSFHSNSLRSLKQALPFPPPAGTTQPVSMIFTIHYKLD